MNAPEPASESDVRDSAPAPAQGANVGLQLRRARERKGISVRELSRRVNLSASLISQVELGKTTPSVGTLYAICSELGLSLDELFSESGANGRAGRGRQGATGPVLGDLASLGPVVRSGAGQVIQLGSGVSWERLTPVTEHDVDFLFVVYDVGGASCPADQLMRHAGKEYGHVVKGRLGVTIGFDTYELDPGDSISFGSTMPHRLFAIGDEPAEAIWFVIGRRGDPRVSHARSD
ncbi:MAG: helix-turn-helix domain-containing protein [Solirubrobacterales bacterium]|nr:helix-turn-helix domain-containing protein [Solirubrobacterales bacterium]